MVSTFPSKQVISHKQFINFHYQSNTEKSNIITFDLIKISYLSDPYNKRDHSF